MNCDDCGDAPASVKAAANGPEGTLFFHFCFGCAKERGLTTDTAGVEAL